MGSLSWVHYLLLGVVAGSIWLTLRLYRHTTTLERIISRWAERRFPAHAPGQHDKAPPWIPFPLSTALLTLIASGAVAAALSNGLNGVIEFSIQGTDPPVWQAQSTAGHYPLLLMAAANLAFLSALLVHWAPAQTDPARRRLKYELVMCFFGFTWLALVLSGIADAAAVHVALPTSAGLLPPEPVSFPIPPRFAAWLLAIPTVLLFLGVLSHRLGLVTIARDRWYPRAARMNRWVKAMGGVAIFLMIFPLELILLAVLGEATGVISVLHLITLLVYFLARYELKAALSKKPILYLRSFHSLDAVAAYSRIVVPEATRYGVVAGLIHATQPAHVLHKDVSTVDRGEFKEVPNDAWQKWVCSALARCHTVIVDVSSPTTSVQWELETALRAVGSARMVLLTGDRVLAENENPEAARIAYGSSKKERKAARRALRSWLIETIERSSGEPQLLQVARTAVASQ